MSPLKPVTRPLSCQRAMPDIPLTVMLRYATMLSGIASFLLRDIDVVCSPLCTMMSPSARHICYQRQYSGAASVQFMSRHDTAR